MDVQKGMVAIMAIERVSEISTVSKSNYNADTAKSIQSAAGSQSVEIAPKETAQTVTVNPKNTENGEGTYQRESSSEQLKKAVSDINRKMKNTSCQFGIHEATNRVMIKLIDDETKEVIREFPAEETLDIIAKAWELAGILVDKKL